jgi:hypothetical protein
VGEVQLGDAYYTGDASREAGDAGISRDANTDGQGGMTKKGQRNKIYDRQNRLH